MDKMRHLKRELLGMYFFVIYVLTIHRLIKKIIDRLIKMNIIISCSPKLCSACKTRLKAQKSARHSLSLTGITEGHLR